MGQDADGNLVLTSVDGADVFLNGIPVVSPSTLKHPAPPCQAGNNSTVYKRFRHTYITQPPPRIGIIPADPKVITSPEPQCVRARLRAFHVYSPAPGPSTSRSIPIALPCIAFPKCTQKTSIPDRLESFAMLPR